MALFFGYHFFSLVLCPSITCSLSCVLNKSPTLVKKNRSIWEHADNSYSKIKTEQSTNNPKSPQRSLPFNLLLLWEYVVSSPWFSVTTPNCLLVTSDLSKLKNSIFYHTFNLWITNTTNSEAHDSRPPELLCFSSNNNFRYSSWDIYCWNSSAAFLRALLLCHICSHLAFCLNNIEISQDSVLKLQFRSSVLSFYALPRHTLMKPNDGLSHWYTDHIAISIFS